MNFKLLDKNLEESLPNEIRMFSEFFLSLEDSSEIKKYLLEEKNVY